MPARPTSCSAISMQPKAKFTSLVDPSHEADAAFPDARAARDRDLALNAEMAREFKRAADETKQKADVFKRAADASKRAADASKRAADASKRAADASKRAADASKRAADKTKQKADELCALLSPSAVRDLKSLITQHAVDAGLPLAQAACSDERNGIARPPLLRNQLEAISGVLDAAALQESFHGKTLGQWLATLFASFGRRRGRDQ